MMQDPRNTAWRGGIASDDNGEIKLAGGWFNNMYGGDGVETQTIMILVNISRRQKISVFALANFDSRFGGVYVDTYLTDTTDMYTAGYMLPLTATNGKDDALPLGQLFVCRL